MPKLNEIPMSPESVDICVLYDPSNGRVVHIHRVATFAGAKQSGKQEIEARCLTVARQLGHATAHLKTLHVPRGEFKPSTPYRVDVQALKLVAQPRPAGWAKFATKQTIESQPKKGT
jgi:hypothetical protein